MAKSKIITIRVDEETLCRLDSIRAGAASRSSLIAEWLSIAIPIAEEFGAPWEWQQMLPAQRAAVLAAVFEAAPRLLAGE